MWSRTLRNSLPDFDREDVLGAIGLESRRSTTEKMLPAVALVGAGLLVGVGLGLLLAPKPGKELREDIKQKLRPTENGHAAARQAHLVDGAHQA